MFKNKDTMTDITKMKLYTASPSESTSPSLPWPLIITWWPQIALQWCTFKHADTMCEIEWKRTPYNVTMGKCDDYEGRVEFKVSSVQPFDEEKKQLENSEKIHLNYRMQFVTNSFAGRLQPVRVWSNGGCCNRWRWRRVGMWLRVLQEGYFIKDNQWKSTIVDDNQWYSMIINDNQYW